MERYLKFGAVLSGFLGFACAAESEEQLGLAEQAQEAFAGVLSNETVLNFEDGDGWRSDTVEVFRSLNQTSGNYSLALKAQGHTIVYSQYLNEKLAPLADTIKFNVFLPAAQANPYWFGYAALNVRVPTKGISRYLGPQMFEQANLGEWTTVELSFPGDLANVLRDLDPKADPLFFEVVLNVPDDAQGTYLIDNLTFGPKVITDSNASEMVELLRATNDEYVVQTSFKLPPGATITRPLAFRGDLADNVTLDCGGGQIGYETAPATDLKWTTTTNRRVISIESLFSDNAGISAEEVRLWDETEKRWVSSPLEPCDYGYEGHLIPDDGKTRDYEEDDAKTGWFFNLAWFLDQPAHTECYRNGRVAKLDADGKVVRNAEGRVVTVEPGEQYPDAKDAEGNRLKLCTDADVTHKPGSPVGLAGLKKACADWRRYFATHDTSTYQDTWLQATCELGLPETICRKSLKKEKSGYYMRQRPENITIRDCKIFGGTRIWGLGQTGQAEYVRQSSYDVALPKHPARARDAAPRDIVFDDVKIKTTAGKVFYLSPGVTHFQLLNSTLDGDASLALYMDAESQRNTLRGNTFSVDTVNPDDPDDARELIAMDGSSENLVVNNYFTHLENGGIYLYRNCGEAGAVRWASPVRNQFINNVFNYRTYSGDKAAIWLGSRDKKRNDWHCPEENALYDNNEDKRLFGGSSAKYDWDYARYNVVMQNQVLNRSLEDSIQVQHSTINSPNYFGEGVGANRTVVTTGDDAEEPEDRAAGCYLPSGYSRNFIADNRTATVMTTQAFTANDWCTVQECVDGVLWHQSFCPQWRIVDFYLQSTLSVFGRWSWGDSTPSCPSGEKVIGAKALCNLDGLTVDQTALNAVDAGLVDVAELSDVTAEGACTVAGTTVASREDAIRGASTDHSIEVSCTSTGNCAVRGYLYCVPES